MSDAGYVRLHRSLLGHPAFRNDAEALAFAWMFARASWRPTRVRYKERSISLQRGQLAISQRDMASALDRDKAWIERLWKRLKCEAMVKVDVEAGVTVVTICNYDEFQGSSESSEAAYEAPREAGVRQGQGTEQRREEDKKKEDISTPNGVNVQNHGFELEMQEAETDHGLKPEEVVEAWNALAIRLGKPQVRKLTPSRRQALKARIKGFSIEEWQEVLGKINASPFLRGDTSWQGCNFDWITKQANFVKILEGNYDR